MPLETGTTLNDLNPLWPENTDPVSESDDHHRLKKSILQSTFGDNPNPGEFNGLDWQFGQNVSVLGEILRNPQVLIAGGQIDGLTGNARGNTFGIVGSAVKTATGTYEIQLTETGWTFEDLTFNWNVDYSFGGIGVATVVPATTNPSTTHIKIVTAPANDPTNAADPVWFSIEVKNMGRS